MSKLGSHRILGKCLDWKNILYFYR